MLPQLETAQAAQADAIADRHQSALATIRSLRESDIPAVVALMARVYPDHGWPSQSLCEDYFHEMLFESPWRDPELASQVAENDGEVVGFQALLPRLMRLNGRLLRVAVSCQFMVDPDRRHGLTALQLIKKCFAGPQDLTIADGANEIARRIWVGLGGQCSLLYSLHWTRPLRPAAFALSMLRKRGAMPAALQFAAQPVAKCLDAASARLRPNHFHRPSNAFTDEPLKPAQMLACLPELMQGYALQPVYDEQSFAWLLEQTARKNRHGKLRSRAVLDSQRRLIGWYLYYLRRGAPGEVVQVAARAGRYDDVLQRLLIDAWRQGATALRGRLDPRFAQELSDHHCWLRREGSFTLFHSRHADLTAAIHRGDAFLSRLEGEWWLRFLGG